MNNIKNAIYVISKLDFNDLAVGAKPSTIKDNNSGVGLQWSVSEVNGGEIKEVDGIKILNFKTNNYKLFTTMSGAADLKNGSIQFEADILIPNMKADNIFFNIGNSSNTGFRFNIKNTFRNGLEVIFGASRVAFNFLFESNKKYNIVVSKDYNVYSLYINGMIVGHCVSNDFNNTINVGSTPTLTIGAKTSSYTSAIDEFIGEISNVNISFGIDSNKYSNSFTKYGDHLISRLNFGNLASVSSSTVFTPGLEAVINSPMTWVYSDVTASGEYGKLNGTPFTSDIGDTGTVYFTMNSGKNVSDIDLVNFNDLYKIIYTYNIEGEPEPEVIVNEYTTSALDFENGLVDKVGTTLWTKEGTASVTDVNTIFGDTSFETKALGDDLSTTSQIITGGATPFTIEFYALLNSFESSSGNYVSIISSENGVYNIIVGRHKVTSNLVFYTNQQVIDQTSNKKLHLNEVNKFSMSYDGAAFRVFVNDEVELVVGISNVQWYANTHFLRDLIDNRNHYGLIDNINIFDGIATKVRDLDQYEEYLVVDLAFDGEDNSTKIIDNGTLKSNWSVTGNAKLSTVQRFDGFSSLYIDSGGMSRISANLSLSLINDFTISFEFIKENDVAAAFFDTRTSTSDYTNSLLITFPSINTNSINVYLNGLDNNWNVSLNSGTFIELNKEYKVDIICKSNNLQIYIDGILKASQQYDFDVSMDVDSRYSTIGKNINGTGGVLQCYIKNFKIYKGVAVIPEDPTGKIQLDFDNNLIDKYNNSTWTNNGVTFDQVNSIKGYAATFNSNSSTITTTSTNLNFESNNFDLSYDIKLTDVSVGNRYSLTNNTNYTTAGSIWFASAHYLGFGYASKPVSSVGISITNIVTNNYYSVSVNRRNNTLFARYNDVIYGTHNLTNQTFNFVNGGNMAAGRSSNFGVGDSFKGYIDNFKSVKESGIVNLPKIIVDKPAVHLPLETNTINTGFTSFNPLTINSVGNPSYTTVDGKKCIKFEQGKYLTINNDNIFNLGASSDFYIELDFYPLPGSSAFVLLSSGSSSADSNLFTITCAELFSGLPNTLYTYLGGTAYKFEGSYNYNSWNNIKIFRKGNNTTYILNGISIEYENLTFNYASQTNATYIGNTAYSSTLSYNGYMSNFKMFVGASEIPETYNDKKVLDLDFKPTGKSYLFKDNNNKCVIHPVNITQRDYQDGQYACTFNGTDQYLQLGKNDLLNFGNDDFVITIKFKVSSFNNIHQRLFADNEHDGAYSYIMVTGNDYSNILYRNCLFFGLEDSSQSYMFSSSKIELDKVYTARFVRENGTVSMFINDVLENIMSNNKVCDFNRTGNTIIGGASVNQTNSATAINQKFHGTIYSIKVLRNTTDLSLLDEETIVYASDEKFTLTNGVEAETIEFTDIKERDVKIVSDTDKVTLKVDDNEVEIPKTSTISNIELFKDYTSQIKDVRVYDIPLLQDDDEFIGSVLIDTQYPELEVLDDGEELQVIDVGNFVIKGFIEGGVGRNYIIRNKIENFELLKGTDDYFYDGIDERYFDNYEIYEVESKQSYPLPKHVMERGVISGVVDTGKCKGTTGKIKPSDMTAWCYSNKDQRLIGSYPVAIDGTYSIPNLDVHSRYDIVFKHNNRLIENISSSYRKPKRVEDAKNPRIIGIDYLYNPDSSFIKYTWQYSTNVTFSSVKLYITENPIIDSTTPFIELGNNMNHYNDYNVTHNHQYYVTIVATYEGNEYRSTQMLVNTHDRTPTVITSVGFNKTTGNVLITW